MARSDLSLRSLLVFTSAVVLGCNGDSLTRPPANGTLEVSTATTGPDPDPDGYTFQIDGGTAQPIGMTATAASVAVSAGDHSVLLAGIAANCAVSGDNPPTVTITASGTEAVRFAVTCTAAMGSLLILTTTKGFSLDPDGYALSIDGGTAQPVGINATLTVGGLVAGPHSIMLSGIASNCHVIGDNPVETGVIGGTEYPTGFTLACLSTTTLSFYQVSAGILATCGVTTTNEAYCWGGNGALGDGTTTESLLPTRVAGGLHFRMISAGLSNTCGVTLDYRAYCWGTNFGGEVGDGTQTTRLTPTPVAGGHRFQWIDINDGHVCAVTYPTPRAYCWGSNQTGQLGDGTVGGFRLKPVAVAGGLPFWQVSTGAYHSCGVTTTHIAYCWGYNGTGQIGDGNRLPRRLTPTRPKSSDQFRMIDAGENHTCAVTTDYRAFCWGSGQAGELGDGQAYISFTPRAVLGGLSFARVTAGAAHSCGETRTKQAYCWGRGGALGNGTTQSTVTPVPVEGGHIFAQLSAGEFHTCGTTTESVAYCWGMNLDGQLGNGTKDNEDHVTPSPVVGPM